jgi:hypothetical protein
MEKEKLRLTEAKLQPRTGRAEDGGPGGGVSEADSIASW